MKNPLIIAALLIAGAAVAFFALNKQPASDSAAPEPAAIAEEATAEEPAAAAEPEESPADETIEVVEESAATGDEQEEAIVLAKAEPAELPQNSPYSEGRHYERMVPTQPTVGGADKVEVAEFFWYGCPHCYDFEPYLQRWEAGNGANVRLVKLPIVWNQVAKLHGQMFYTAEVLIRNGDIKDGKEFHNAVFEEYHRRGNRMTSMAAIRKVFERFGVNAEKLDQTWNSYEVDQKLRIADDLMRRYKIDGVPAVVVNGKYRSGAADAGGYPKLLDLVDELVLRESLR